MCTTVPVARSVIKPKRAMYAHTFAVRGSAAFKAQQAFSATLDLKGPPIFRNLTFAVNAVNLGTAECYAQVLSRQQQVRICVSQCCTCRCQRTRRRDRQREVPHAASCKSTMTVQVLLKGQCAHTTARQFWRRQLYSRRFSTSTRCSAIREAQASLRKKERSAVDILEQYLHRLETTEPMYHSFLSTDTSAARAQVIEIPSRAPLV